MSQIINPGTASGGGFDENGTYPNMTVGEATKATQDGQGEEYCFNLRNQGGGFGGQGAAHRFNIGN